MNSDEAARFLNPVLEVEVGNRSVGRWVAQMGVTSDRRGRADTCVLTVADTSGELGRSIKRGEALTIGWGYAGEDLTEIFQGVAREVGIADPLVIRGIDYNVILNSRRITTTFEGETASGIVKALLAGTGLKLAIEECDLEIERLPMFNRTLREGLEAVKEIIRSSGGETYDNYIREGVFHWERANLQTPTTQNYQTGVNIINTDRTPEGLIQLETLVSPVHHSKLVSIDGIRHYVVKVEYWWNSGGRTRLEGYPC